MDLEAHTSRVAGDFGVEKTDDMFTGGGCIRMLRDVSRGVFHVARLSPLTGS